MQEFAVALIASAIVVRKLKEVPNRTCSPVVLFTTALHGRVHLWYAANVSVMSPVTCFCLLLTH